ncbi:MAG: regulator of chromosome condensation, partial [Acidimicrobiales bacterium]|nr:regulator of chromosome condensation [Acidimicrobiales bacterium]
MESTTGATRRSGRSTRAGLVRRAGSRGGSVLTLVALLAATLTVAVSMGAPAAGADPVQTWSGAVAAGVSHTCGVTAGGGVKCWGSNGTGQLGNGSTTQSAAPVDVTGLASGVVSVAAGERHSCAVTTAGGVKCWGYNFSGQLGNGSNTQSTTPVNVTGLTSGVVSVAAGGNHSCAVTSAGGVKCWGDNVYGQLGNGSNTQSTTPVNVTGLASGAASVAVAAGYACAVTTAGGVKCWGYNAEGQLGNGSTTHSPTPVNVTGLTSGVVVAAGGGHSCAVTAAGGVKCWGYNGNGQLGNGSITQSTTPGDVTGLASGVVSVAAGGLGSCALTSAGGVKCWGGNSGGQLGNGSNTQSTTPVDVTGLTSGVASVAAGSGHSCALTSAGGVKCWGGNGNGQLGSGASAQSTTPVDATGLTSGVASVATGSGHSCSVTTAGGAKCWGGNASGQLGNGSNTPSTTPVDVTGLASGVASVATTSNHSCAVTTGGGVKCWATNGNGQLGNGSTIQSRTPVDVTGLTAGAASVATGASHSCAMTTAGAVKCWGGNGNGQLGTGSSTQSTTPVDVTGLSSGVVSVAAGGNHSCAVTAAGGVKCWGYNGNGQLGNGSTTQSTTPVDVTGLTSGVAAVAAGSGHSCALTSAGGVKCWGYNGSGQLGNG